MVGAAAGGTFGERHDPALAGFRFKVGSAVFLREEGQRHYGRGDIYCSRLIDGRYGEPVNLGPAINTRDSEAQPFIAPDESFILFWRAPGQVPSAYVSFKGQNGEWLPAVKFELPWAPGGLMISPDGQYLFAAGRWRSAKFLDDLRPKSEEGASAGRR